MARTTAAAAAASVPAAPDARAVPIDLVEPSATNPRTHLDVDEDFVENIKAYGILEPLIVTPADGYDGTEDRPRMTLIAGHRRLEAAKLAGLTHVPVIVRADLGDAKGQALAQLIENLQRVDLSPLDEARGYQRLIDEFEYSQADVALAVNRNQGHVSKRMTLLKLVPEAAALVAPPDRATKPIALDVAVDLAKLPKAGQAGAVDAIKRGIEPSIAVSNAKRRVTELAERGKALRELKQIGARIYDEAVEADGAVKAGITAIAQIFGGDTDKRDAHRKEPCAITVVRVSPQHWGDTALEKWTYDGCDAENAWEKHRAPATDADVAAAGDPEAAAARAAEDAERARRQAEAEERRNRLAGLSSRRLAFCADLLAGKKPKGVHDFLARTTFLSVFGYQNETPDLDAAAQLLGITPDLTGVAGLLVAEEAAGRLVGDQAIRWALAFRFVDAERDVQRMVNGGRWSTFDVLPVEYVRYLQACGLELEDEELAVLGDDVDTVLRETLIELDLLVDPQADAEPEPDVAEPPVEDDAGPVDDAPVDDAPAEDVADVDVVPPVEDVDDAGEPVDVPDAGPTPPTPEQDADERGVTREARTDLMMRTGLGLGAVYLRAEVSRAEGRCTACDGWVKVNVGAKAAKHQSGTGPCDGSGRRTLTYAEAVEKDQAASLTA